MPSEVKTPGGQEPERSLKIGMGKKLLRSDRNMSRMCYESFIINGIQYCRPHLLTTCHLCKVSNEHLRDDCDSQRLELGLREGGDPALNRRADQWTERIHGEQLTGQLRFDELRLRLGGDLRLHPREWNRLKAELRAKERQLNDELLADVAKTLKQGASQCCYWACAEPAADKLLRCGGCGVAKYCSKEHQAMDWRWEHKLECSKSTPRFVLDEIESDRERNLRGDYEKAERIR